MWENLERNLLLVLVPELLVPAHAYTGVNQFKQTAFQD